MKKYYIPLGWSRSAIHRQIIANWHAFTDGDPVPPEIQEAINLTRILEGPQYGDPDTRNHRPSFKAKHKP